MPCCSFFCNPQLSYKSIFVCPSVHFSFYTTIYKWSSESVNVLHSYIAGFLLKCIYILQHILPVLSIISWNFTRNFRLVYIDYNYASYLSLLVKVFKCKHHSCGMPTNDINSAFIWVSCTLYFYGHHKIQQFHYHCNNHCNCIIFLLALASQTNQGHTAAGKILRSSLHHHKSCVY